MAVTRARSHSEPATVAGKQLRLDEPHVAPLTRLCERIATDVRYQVPGADPDWGGVRARVLVLLRDPGTMTDGKAGSGLVSPDNDDPTAERLHGLIAETGLRSRDVLLWNAVPWLRPGNAGQRLSVAEMDAGNRWLAELLALLQRLRVVLVLGRDAQEALARRSASQLDGYVRIDAPHPGQLSQNRPVLRAALDAAFGQVASALAGEAPVGTRLDLWPRRTGEGGAP